MKFLGCFLVGACIVVGMKTLLAIAVVVYLIRRPEFRAAYRRSFERTVEAGSGVRDPERVRIKGVDY